MNVNSRYLCRLRVLIRLQWRVQSLAKIKFYIARYGTRLKNESIF